MTRNNFKGQGTDLVYKAIDTTTGDTVIKSRFINVFNAKLELLVKQYIYSVLASDSLLDTFTAECYESLDASACVLTECAINNLSNGVETSIGKYSIEFTAYERDELEIEKDKLSEIEGM